jgi:hypothetical protein
MEVNNMNINDVVAHALSKRKQYTTAISAVRLEADAQLGIVRLYIHPRNSLYIERAIGYYTFHEKDGKIVDLFHNGL